MHVHRTAQATHIQTVVMSAANCAADPSPKITWQPGPPCTQSFLVGRVCLPVGACFGAGSGLSVAQSEKKCPLP